MFVYESVRFRWRHPFQSPMARKDRSRGGRSPPKTYKSNFIQHDFVQFGKHHSRYKDILSSIVLSQQFCKVYFISLAVTKLLYETCLPSLTEIAPLNLLSGSTPDGTHDLFAKLPSGCTHEWRNLFQSGGVQVHVKKIYSKFCGLNWQLWRHKHWNMTSLHIHHMKV